MGSFRDLTGQRFGMLVVISRASNRGKRTAWNCRCDCGNDTIVIGANLVRGHTQSCGCNTAKAIGAKLKKYNRYDLSGDYGVGYCSDGTPFYFDKEDYDLIKDYCWCNNGYGYIVAGEIGDSKKLVLMHQLITGKKYQDHKNTHKNDNRKENLRDATRSQNNMNRGIQSNNTSGVTGVQWDKKQQKWVAQIKISGKTILLGYYPLKEEAVYARKEAEKKYFGEFAYQG